MLTKLDDPDQTRLAVAALFVALVRALGERDESVPSGFDAEVQRIHHQMREYQDPPLRAMEALRWAHEMLQEP